jgi:PAS domain S-box-containing protein
MLVGLSKFFRIPINLIRLEIIFAALFCIFFSAFVNTLTELEINTSIGVGLSVVFLFIGVLSFLTNFTKKILRILSNFTYITGFYLILYVVYLNQFSAQACYLLIITYGLYCFSLSSIKIYIKLNVIIWLLTIFFLFLLRFETKISLWFIAFAYISLGLSGFAIAFARSTSKNKNRDRSEYLNVVFNNSSNALLLFKGESLTFIDANQKAKQLLDFSESRSKKHFDVSELNIGGEYIFRALKSGEKKTIELPDQRLIRVDKKQVKLENKLYYLIEIEEFKDRIELSETLEFNKLKIINEESYKNLFKTNPSLISIVNKNGKIIDINDTYLDFLGYVKSEVVGIKYSALDYRNYSKERKIIQAKAWSGETQLFEKQIISKSGTILFIEAIVRKSKYFGEDVLISIARDISQRKMLEKKAIYNQYQYSTLFRESPIGLFISDLDGDIVETNKSFQLLLGYKKNEFTGKNMSFFSGNKSSIEEKKLVKNLLVEKKNFVELQTIYKKKNGQVIHILLKINVQKNEDDIAAKLLGQVIDITNFIESESSLKASLKSYKDAFNTSFELRYILGLNNEFVDVSNSVEKEYKYSREEIIGRTPDFLADSTKMDSLQTQRIIQLAWEGKDQDILWWSKRKDGTIFPKKLHIRQGVYFGQRVLMCSGQNVQKELEHKEQILLSEKKYKDLINQTIFGILIFKANKVVFANQRAGDTLKYKSFREIIGLNRSNIFKLKELQILKESEANIRDNEFVSLRELELIDANGEFIFVESIATKIQFEGEECILNSFVEISDRKKVEEGKLKAEKQESDNDSLRFQLEQNRIIQRRLQNSQSYSEAIIESSLDMIFTTDVNGRINKMNSAAKAQFQYDRKEFIQQQFSLLLRDEEEEKNIFKELKISKSYSGKLEMRRKDGSVFPSLLSASQLFNNDGTFLGIMGITRDISEMVAKESEIKKQASKLNSLIESSSHYFFTINKEYRFTSFNKIFLKDIKHNYNVDLKIFDDFFELVKVARKKNKIDDNFWKPIFNKAFDGESTQFEIERKNVKNEIYSRELYVNPIFGENGEIDEILGIGHDITQKKRNEDELTNSLKEKEILLKEVHHRVKNNMQVISSILSLQSAYVTDRRVLDVLRESRNRIAAMASIHERLYTTTNLSNFRFSSYIKDLAESLVNTYELSNTSVELVFSLDEVFLSLNNAIPCGLILNELISNSLKYAFEGMKYGRIDINLSSKSGKISLSLEDNGVGISEEITAENTDTLGLQLVSTLVEQMEGELRLERNNGTKFTISFTINNEA